MNQNAALTKCYLCGKDNEILLSNKYKQNGESAVDMFKYHGKVVSKEPCNECKDMMKQGIMLIHIADDDPEYRMGNICVIKEEAFARIFGGEEGKHALKMRATFVQDAVWKALGLPTNEDTP